VIPSLIILVDFFALPLRTHVSSLLGKSCSSAWLLHLVPSRVCVPGQGFHFVVTVRSLSFAQESAPFFGLARAAPGF
jgi:hypothetical protein